MKPVPSVVSLPAHYPGVMVKNGLASKMSAANSERPRELAAIVYCEGNFGDIDGKTANGLVRHSEKYKIVAVIDSGLKDLDAGAVLDDCPNGIPVCRDLGDALLQIGTVPDAFIFGMAPSSGMLSPHERKVVLNAIGLGMDIVSGLHEFLGDDPELQAASVAAMVRAGTT